MVDQDPRAPTRTDLARIFVDQHGRPNQRLIRAFEKLFDLVPSGLISNDAAAEIASLVANSATSKADLALGQLSRVANALEGLLLAPRTEAANTEELTPPDVLYDRDVPYGEFYAVNTTITVTVGAANTAYEVNSGMTEGLTNLSTFGGNHYIEVGRGGVYEVNWSMAAEASNPTDEIEGGFMVDGTAQSNGTSHTGSAAAANDIGATGLIKLSAGQQVSLFVRNHSGANDIDVEHATFTIKRIKP